MKKTNIEELVVQLEGLANTSIEIAKCELIHNVAKILSSLAAWFLLATFGLLGLLFTCLTLAFRLGSYFGESYLGFAVVTILILVFFVFIYLFRYTVVKRIFRNKIIQHLQ
jgi:hypothetical protein